MNNFWHFVKFHRTAKWISKSNHEEKRGKFQNQIYFTYRHDRCVDLRRSSHFTLQESLNHQILPLPLILCSIAYFCLNGLSQVIVVVVVCKKCVSCNAGFDTSRFMFVAQPHGCIRIQKIFVHYLIKYRILWIRRYHFVCNIIYGPHLLYHKRFEDWWDTKLSFSLR